MRASPLDVCGIDGCDRPARKGGRCWCHSKRIERGMPVDVVVKGRPRTPLERAVEAAIRYADATDDDDEYRRAYDNLRKSIAACAPSERAAIDRELRSRLTREGLERVRAAGARLGRPSKVHPAIAEQTVEEAGGIAKAAAFLRVSVWTIRRALRRGGA